MRSRSSILFVVVALLSSLVGGVSSGGQRSLISVPAESLVSVDDLSGLTLETSGRFLSRRIEWADTGVDLDGWFWTVGLGFSPASFIRVGGFAGAASADVDSREGDYGPVWGVNASIALLEYVLEESPVFGQMKAVRLITDVEYVRAEPGLDGNDITIEEFILAPHVVYALNLRGADRWHPYTLLGTSLRGGIVMSSLEADIDDHSFQEASNFGLLLGADMQFNEELALRVTGYLYSTDDLTINASLGYYF